MKAKISITLSRDVLVAIDRLAGDESRSGFIERVLGGYLGQRARQEANARDLKRLNAAAERLNAEVADVLEYQAPWAGDED